MSADKRVLEFRFDNNVVAVDEVLKINNTLTVEGYDKNVGLKNVMRMFIDELGKNSAKARELKTPVTSADELVNSDHNVYLLTQNDTPKRLSVDGILNMGWKNLYLYDKNGSRSESMVYCLMDFYIHKCQQRKGLGKRLIEFMLKDMDLHAKDLAIYKPTKTLLQFMSKHYKLSKLVDQGNNIVVYEDYFSAIDTSENGLSTNTFQSSSDQHQAQIHHDQMSDIVQAQGDADSLPFKYNTDLVDNQFKEVNPYSENESVFQSNMDGHFKKQDIKSNDDAECSTTNKEVNLMSNLCDDNVHKSI